MGVCITVHMCCVDLEKAVGHVFCGILQEALWDCGFGGPLRVAAPSLYDQSRSLVCMAAVHSDLFLVRVGLHQRCHQLCYFILWTQVVGPVSAGDVVL